MSLLSASLCASEFERHESALRHSVESADVVLARHMATLRHGMDVSDLILEHKVHVSLYKYSAACFTSTC